jgi:DNA-binding NarL/FixJ family response regulator
MPEMNGDEVAIEIKRHRPEIPIVMVSSDDEISERALKVVDAFIPKGEASSRLLPVISQICDDDSPGSAIRSGTA